MTNQSKLTFSQIEAAVAACRADFWAAVDEYNNGERTNASHAQLEQILQALRDQYA